MINIDIKITYARAKGENHKKYNKSCEDYVDGIVLDQSSAVIALSDGGGSKKYALETATALVNKVIQLAETDSCFTLTSDEIVNIMNNEVYALNLPVEETGATLLFVIIKNGKYLVGHIGDGVIICKHNDEFTVLSHPANGLFDNQTYFIPTDLKYSERMRLYTGNVKSNQSFILASDGIADLIYDFDTDKGMNICNKLDTWNRELSKEDSEKIIETTLVNNLSQYTYDDMSLAVLSVL